VIKEIVHNCDTCKWQFGVPENFINPCGTCRSTPNKGEFYSNWNSALVEKEPDDKNNPPEVAKRDSRVSIHRAICKGLTELYETKNRDYGDSFSKARIDVPNYTLGKLYDKFSRYMNLCKNGNAHYETVEDTLRDLANYAIMELRT
jgi:hypothetical protein